MSWVLHSRTLNSPFLCFSCRYQSGTSICFSPGVILPAWIRSCVPLLSSNIGVAVDIGKPRCRENRRRVIILLTHRNAAGVSASVDDDAMHVYFWHFQLTMTASSRITSDDTDLLSERPVA